MSEINTCIVFGATGKTGIQLLHRGILEGKYMRRIMILSVDNCKICCNSEVIDKAVENIIVAYIVREMPKDLIQ